ncbi:hypothetical protein GCM10020229_56280 [Kitasatospora albolonga]
MDRTTHTGKTSDLANHSQAQRRNEKYRRDELTHIAGLSKNRVGTREHDATFYFRPSARHNPPPPHSSAHNEPEGGTFDTPEPSR